MYVLNELCKPKETIQNKIYLYHGICFSSSEQVRCFRVQSIEISSYISQFMFLPKDVKVFAVLLRCAN